MDSELHNADGNAVESSGAPIISRRALAHHLGPLQQFLLSDTTDLCINKPQEVWVESSKGWARHSVPELTLDHLQNLARTVSNSAKQGFNTEKPIMSAALPTGERIQMVLPPACTEGTVSVTLRKPSEMRFSLDDYRNSGFFNHVRIERSGLLDHERELMAMLKERRLEDFFRLAVASRQTLLVSGGTGSGKTTFMKALVDLIPASERCITIEDTPELDLPNLPNHVRLFYSKGGQGQAKVSASDLLESCMRMKPDRILQAEIRDSAAFHFINGSNSGHPGSMTSIHANSEREAFGRAALLLGGAEEASGMSRQDVMNLIVSTVDIVIQVGRANGIRAVTGIYYEPERKLALMG